MRTVRVVSAVSALLLAAGCGSGTEPVVNDQPTRTSDPTSQAAESPQSAQPTSDATAQASPSPTAEQAPTPSGPGEVVAPSIAGTVATGLRSPWGLTFLPGGAALVSERDTARVVRVEDGGGVRQVGSVPGVSFGGEGGLLGLAVSPTFGDDRLVYAYHSAAGGNRVVRMPLRSGRLGAPEVVIDGIPVSSIHNGGRVAFGPDGMLYVTTGDASNTGLSQRQDSLAGKILRLTPDGGVPDDNPDPGSPVYSFGHRNVQGLAWDDEGNLWASEFGANTWDELNLIKPGGNYGWPEVEGGGGPDRFRDPAVQWPTETASPSGLTFAEGTLYMAALRGQRLWAVPVGDGRAGEPTAFFTDDLGRLRTVEQAPDGSLWLVTNNTDGRGNPGPDDDRILELSLD
jgi:aldose sugar dehydrogenase